MMKKEDSDRHAIGDEVDSSKERSKSHVTESYHDNVSSSISNERHPYTQKHIPMKPNTAPGGRRGRKRDDVKVLFEEDEGKKELIESPSSPEHIEKESPLEDNAQESPVSSTKGGNQSLQKLSPAEKQAAGEDETSVSSVSKQQEDKEAMRPSCSVEQSDVEANTEPASTRQENRNQEFGAPSTPTSSLPPR
ncbi:hypothetical protein ADUPG1_002948, partial [Aduncisulcus paluster]